mmetsp:Transcript_33616/g.78643  ORF Transcript_33616/g.78643 Transcript_33616/m.78643 type:complete len:149 (-) Transcript_33616:241-687(-)
MHPTTHAKERERVLQGAIRLAPANPEGALALASQMGRQLGREDEAVHLLRSAVQLAPTTARQRLFSQLQGMRRNLEAALVQREARETEPHTLLPAVREWTEWVRQQRDPSLRRCRAKLNALHGPASPASANRCIAHESTGERAQCSMD